MRRGGEALKEGRGEEEVERRRYEKQRRRGRREGTEDEGHSLTSVPYPAPPHEMRFNIALQRFVIVFNCLL